MGSRSHRPICPTCFRIIAIYWMLEYATFESMIDLNPVHILYAFSTIPVSYQLTTLPASSSSSGQAIIHRREKIRVQKPTTPQLSPFSPFATSQLPQHKPTQAQPIFQLSQASHVARLGHVLYWNKSLYSWGTERPIWTRILLYTRAFCAAVILDTECRCNICLGASMDYAIMLDTQNSQALARGQPISSGDTAFIFKNFKRCRLTVLWGLFQCLEALARHTDYRGKKQKGSLIAWA